MLVIFEQRLHDYAPLLGGNHDTCCMIAPLAEKVITQEMHENTSLDKGPESAPVHLGLPPEALLALRASPEGRGVPP